MATRVSRMGSSGVANVTPKSVEFGVTGTTHGALHGHPVDHIFRVTRRMWIYVIPSLGPYAGPSGDTLTHLRMYLIWRSTSGHQWVSGLAVIHP